MDATPPLQSEPPTGRRVESAGPFLHQSHPHQGCATLGYQFVAADRLVTRVWSRSSQGQVEVTYYIMTLSFII